MPTKTKRTPKIKLEEKEEYTRINKILTFSKQTFSQTFKNTYLSLILILEM